MKKKILKYSIGTAVVIGLLSASVQVSPAMANVASQVPIVGDAIRDELKEDIILALKKEGFEVQALYVREAYPDGKKVRDIQVEILHTENRVSELKDTINKVVESNKLKPFPIQVQKIDPAKQAQDNRWATIMSEVNQKLTNKKVKQLSYTVYPEPKLTITIPVEGTSTESKSYAKDIEAEMNEILESEELSEWVKGEKYQLEIFSEDKSRLN